METNLAATANGDAKLSVVGVGRGIGGGGGGSVAGVSARFPKIKSSPTLRGGRLRESNVSSVAPAGGVLRSNSNNKEGKGAPAISYLNSCSSFSSPDSPPTLFPPGNRGSADGEGERIRRGQEGHGGGNGICFNFNPASDSRSRADYATQYRASNGSAGGVVVFTLDSRVDEDTGGEAAAGAERGSGAAEASVLLPSNSSSPASSRQNSRPKSRKNRVTWPAECEHTVTEEGKKQNGVTPGKHSSSNAKTKSRGQQKSPSSGREGTATTEKTPMLEEEVFCL